MKDKTIDWPSIEVAYRAGIKSIRSIAESHNVTEGGIRNRAKKNGWVRDPEGTKRELVRAAMSGASQGATQNAVRTAIESEVSQDVEDMQAGLAVARGCIYRLQMMVATSDSARDIKTIVEANKGAIETIRRIRGLDEAGADELANKLGEGVAMSAAEAYKRMIGG